jgi:hypothetical protein
MVARNWAVPEYDSAYKDWEPLAENGIVAVQHFSATYILL